MTNINIEELKKREAFKVPEHYFDNLTERVMANIPAEETNVISISKKKTSNNWWKWSSVAASIAIIAIGSALIFNHSNTVATQETEQFANNTEEMSQEEMMEYTMLDGEDVYCYLAGEAY